ncbi:hypothetical protein [Allostreptomyces psammosilenae]|uniref:NAD-dependent SIR2 family protein deacetylase n=1 Tax=Allostreptomyces psammosilenae TaxID=1892865 RepID=A0A853AAP3_9ACTN|nr:hypothetical protein [Allostreptomyces psammosilenae]NYI07691.1 NAD-dependent SIR2 family protein deacetylase [Allostreptomyces psammosilenae]
MNTTPSTRVVLSVDPARFAEVVAALRGAGLAVEAEFPTIGSVTGTVAQDRLAALRAVDGVQAVEPERTYRPLQE